MSDHLAPPSTSQATSTSLSHSVSKDSPSDGHGAVRPSAPIGAATQRDIHISEQGQHEHPKGPTRIATWRPIPGQSNPKVEFTPNAEQASLISQLKAYTESELVLKEGHELYESYGRWERRFLERKDTYSRYMRAADWKMDNAKKRIKETLEWRRGYQPDLIKPEEIRVEAQGGKVIVNGFDRDGRPIVWLRPSRENTKPSPTQIRHLIFQLERAIDLLPDGVEKLALVVDYKGATSTNNPSLKTVKEVIYILQNHYVERLGKGVVVNVPFYLNAFFNMVKPLLDPKTKAKVAFNPSLEKLIPNDHLDSEFKHGDYEYIYDPNVYLTALCHFCGVKEDGTREDVIPVRDSANVRPEEIQRSLTASLSIDTAEEEAEFARKEAEAIERQKREAEEYEKSGGQVPILDGDEDTSTPNKASTTNEANEASNLTANKAEDSTDGAQVNERDFGASDNTAGAAVAGASVAAAAAAGGAGLAAHHASKAHEGDSAEKHPNGPAAQVASPSQQAQIPQAPSPAAANPTAPKSVDTKQPSRKRGGWKLFSAKRGLDKQGNATLHKHKHMIKAFCMHKGAIDPSWGASTPSQDKTVSAAPVAVPVHETTPANGDAQSEANGSSAAAGGGRIKIAPEATEGREERTYNNAPLATNATFGPDAYHTAMEAYPNTAGVDREGPGDYFTDLRKIPPVKPAPVDDEHQDQAKMVKRPTEIMNQLHEGGTGDLVLAFEVKQPPVEQKKGEEASAATLENGDSSTLAKEGLSKNEEKAL